MSDYKSDSKKSKIAKMRSMGCFADGGDVGTKFTDLMGGPMDRPEGPMAVIDPGKTWGGKDKNAILPDDVAAPKPLQKDI